MPRPIDLIIREIIEENPPLVELAAYHLVRIKLPTDRFNIRSFLGNVGNWHGVSARRLKAELREYLK